MQVVWRGMPPGVQVVPGKKADLYRARIPRDRQQVFHQGAASLQIHPRAGHRQQIHI